MSGYRKCAVSGCENKTAPRHRFPNPTKNLDRFQVWLKACASETLCSLDPDLVYRSHRVCNIHFSKEDACRNNYLSRLAVPKLFVCSSEDSFTCDPPASTNIALERVRSSHLYVPEAKRTRLEMIVDQGSVPSCSVPADPDNRKLPSPSVLPGAEESEENKDKEATVNDIIVIDPKTTELDLNHGRIGKIDNLEPLECIERLYLRWNFISKIENLSTLTTLVELELYDNQITEIENLDALVNLEILDLSFNHIKEIKGLENLTSLKKLYLLSNKISKIENVNHLESLTLLELGDNKIKEIDNLSGLINLNYLYLGKNKISKISNLDALVNLTCISLQSNRITVLENLQALVNLDELYVSENGITEISGLENNVALQTLDLAMNQIKAIKNIKHLENLEEFWLNDNQVAEWVAVEELTANKKISTVYLERNPIASDPAYRRKLKLLLPSLTQIDATLCR